MGPDGRVATHPLLGARARLAHTQALALLELLRVLLERVAEGPEGLALGVKLGLDLRTRGGSLDAWGGSCTGWKERLELRAVPLPRRDAIVAVTYACGV